jgi:hypothetical protein
MEISPDWCSCPKCGGRSNATVDKQTEVRNITRHFGTNINADMRFGNELLPRIVHGAILQLCAYTPIHTHSQLYRFSF